MSRASPATSPEQLAHPPYLLGAYAATLPSALIAEEVANSADLVAALKVLCLAAFAWHGVALWRGHRAAPSGAALAAATGLLWAALAVIFLFKVVTMMSFNFSMVVSSLEDAGRTLVHTLGAHGVAIAWAVLASLALGAGALVWGLLRALRAAAGRLRAGPRSALVCMGLIGYLAMSDLWYATHELVLYPRSYFLQRYIPGPLSAPDYSKHAVRSRESVFVLQLESVNTFALFERSADAAGFRRRVPQAGLETVLREGGGVLFPFFWANSTQTHRAWEAILCGVSGNAGPPISLEPARLLRRTCLPRLLGESDYARVFLYSYFEIEFFNLRGFASMAGFQDVAYGDKLMAPGDTRHEWAYDDCVFYRRAFEHLAREGLDKRERVFAYFEVGMNHWPFAGTMKHPQAHPYREPSSALEHYVNSLSEQDHCLLEFWRRFRALGRDDVHLFILPDHSLWVRGAPLAPDSGFATWLAYVPPARRAAEFKPGVVLEPMPSQAQIYPTVLELLEGTRLPRSFAFALRGEPAPSDYEDCQLLSEPFQRVIVRRGDARSEYRLGSGEIALPGAPARAAGFDEFRDQFVCR